MSTIDQAQIRDISSVKDRCSNHRAALQTKTAEIKAYTFKAGS